MNKTNNTNTINIVNKSNTNGNKTSSYNNGSNSGTGGSNNVPEKIKSFPIDKYTGPGVVGFLYNNSLPISDEAKNNNKLWGLQIDNKNDENIGINKIQKTSKTKNNIDEKSDKKNTKDESSDEESNLMYGPLFIIVTDSFISRGLHGPWYYEKKYVDNILMKKKEVLNTYNNDEKVRDNSNLKYIRIIIGGFVLTILVIIYGILNMKLLEKKSIEKDE